MKYMTSKDQNASHDDAKKFSLFVLNSAVELAGVITIEARSAGDARERFEATRSADQHLISVLSECSQTSWHSRRS